MNFVVLIINDYETYTILSLIRSSIILRSSVQRLRDHVIALKGGALIPTATIPIENRHRAQPNLNKERSCLTPITVHTLTQKNIDFCMRLESS